MYLDINSDDHNAGFCVNGWCQTEQHRLQESKWRPVACFTDVFNPSVISRRKNDSVRRAAAPVTTSQRFGFPRPQSGLSVGVMSDSEDESQDRQLKIVVIGDGACGKVRRPSRRDVRREFTRREKDGKKRGALVRITPGLFCRALRRLPRVHGNRRDESYLGYRG